MPMLAGNLRVNEKTLCVCVCVCVCCVRTHACMHTGVGGQVYAHIRACMHATPASMLLFTALIPVLIKRLMNVCNNLCGQQCAARSLNLVGCKTNVFPFPLYKSCINGMNSTVHILWPFLDLYPPGHISTWIHSSARGPRTVLSCVHLCKQRVRECDD